MPRSDSFSQPSFVVLRQLSRRAALLLAFGSFLVSTVCAQPATSIPAQTNIARAACDQARTTQRWAEALAPCQVVLHAAEQTLGPKDESVAYWLNEVGLILRHLDRNADAETLVQRSLHIWEQALGSDHLDVVHALLNLASLYEGQRRYSDAERLYRRALRIIEKAGRQKIIGYVQRQLFGVYLQLERYSEAELAMKRSLDIFERAQAYDHSSVVFSLQLLARFYTHQFRYSDAEPLYQRALQIIEKALGPDHADAAAVLDDLAREYSLLHNYTAAESALRRRLRIVEKTRGPQDPAVAEVLFDLADTFWNQERRTEAEEYFQRALNMAERVVPPKDPWTPFHLYLWGVKHLFHGGPIDRAENLLLRCMKSAEYARSIKNTPDTNALLYATWHALSMVYEDQGRFDEAEQSLQRSVEIAEQRPETEEPKREHLPILRVTIREFLMGNSNYGESALSALVHYYMRRDAPAKAIPLLNQLIERGLRRKPIIDAKLLGWLEQLGVIHQHLGQKVELGRLWTRLVSELSQVKRSDQDLTEEVRSKLALLLERAFFHFWQERRFDESEKLVTQVTALPLAKDPVIAQALKRLNGQLKTAPKSELSELDAQAKLANGHDDEQAIGLFQLGFAAARQDRNVRALRLLREGLYLSDAHLRRQKSVQAVAEWLARTRPFVELIWELARRQHGKKARDSEEDSVQLAWTATLLSKGRALDAETKHLRIMHESKAAQQHPQLWSMREAVKNRMRQGAVGAMDSGALHELGQQARNAEATLSQLTDSSHIEVLPEPFELVRAVAARLPHDGVLVDFVEYAPPQIGVEAAAARYLALLLFPAKAPQEPRMQLLDLGEVQSLGPHLAALLRALHDPASQPEKEAQATYDALLAPVKKAAGDVTQLWLVPDGALNLIPFDALHDREHYVLDSSTRVRYLTSGRDLLVSYRMSHGQAPLVLGNPALQAVAIEPEQARARQASAERGSGNTNRGINGCSAGRFDALQDLLALPDAEQEAREIAALVRVTALLGAAASEHGLRDRILRGGAPRILHLAMHGVVPDDVTGTTVFGARSRSVLVPSTPSAQPTTTSLAPVHEAASTTPSSSGMSPELCEPMLQSALLLAGAAKARDAHRADSDGILTADEARELPLHGTELVVLSACKTALGSIRAGDGVYGLRRAFMAAGAKAVVASLWRVADQPTHSLMQAYYSGLIFGRKPRIQAMREAMLEVKKSHPHPYYWAPFIAIGHDAPIELPFPH